MLWLYLYLWTEDDKKFIKSLSEPWRQDLYKYRSSFRSFYLDKGKMGETMEERQALGRLIEVGNLYDVRQDKVLVSPIFSHYFT